MTDFDFLVEKADLLRTRWLASPAVRPPPNGVVVELERFALTANNLTYAKLGDALGYWRYFPAPQGFGRMPVWGVACIVESANAELAEGERVYGFLPVSTRCALTPAPRAAFGFVDAAPHRADLPSAYNEYRLIDRDSNWDRNDENAFLALRPLFILGFFLAEWLAEEKWFGCERVVVSSASSKAATALGRQIGARVETIGLTSERNRSTVAKMGIFDRAIAYSAVADEVSLAERPAIFVDIAGDAGLEASLERRMGAALVRTVAVGATRGDPARFRMAPEGEGGQRADVFFAPAHIPRLKDAWGPATLRDRLAQSWASYLATVQERLTFESCAGRTAIARACERVAQGAAPADLVTILTAPGLE